MTKKASKRKTFGGDDWPGPSIRKVFKTAKKTAKKAAKKARKAATKVAKKAKKAVKKRT